MGAVLGSLYPCGHSGCGFVPVHFKVSYLRLDLGECEGIGFKIMCWLVKQNPDHLEDGVRFAYQIDPGG